jgi:hypothetical protein
MAVFVGRTWSGDCELLLGTGKGEDDGEAERGPPKCGAEWRRCVPRGV